MTGLLRPTDSIGPAKKEQQKTIKESLQLQQGALGENQKSTVPVPPLGVHLLMGLLQGLHSFHLDRIKLVKKNPKQPDVALK